LQKAHITCSLVNKSVSLVHSVLRLHFPGHQLYKTSTSRLPVYLTGPPLLLLLDAGHKKKAFLPIPMYIDMLLKPASYYQFSTPVYFENPFRVVK
jgi:hypothetical protein